MASAEPSPATFDAVFVRIRCAHPEWSRVRVHQRTMVEVYLEHVGEMTTQGQVSLTLRRMKK
jgi:hypothetical protein